MNSHHDLPGTEFPSSLELHIGYGKRVYGNAKGECPYVGCRGFEVRIREAKVKVSSDPTTEAMFRVFQ